MALVNFLSSSLMKKVGINFDYLNDINDVDSLIELYFNEGLELDD